jgi:hypothetical protein
MKQKTCWVARQYSKGWRLGFAVGNAQVQYIPLVWFQDKKDVEKALNNNCVYVFMANSEEVER